MAGLLVLDLLELRIYLNYGSVFSCLDGFSADLFHHNHTPFINGSANEQACQRGVSRLGQGDWRGKRFLGPDGGEEVEQGQPGVVLGARVNDLPGPLAVAEGQQAGAEVEAALLAQDPEGRAGESV